MPPFALSAATGGARTGSAVPGASESNYPSRSSSRSSLASVMSTMQRAVRTGSQHHQLHPPGPAGSGRDPTRETIESAATRLQALELERAAALRREEIPSPGDDSLATANSSLCDPGDMASPLTAVAPRTADRARASSSSSAAEASDSNPSRARLRGPMPGDEPRQLSQGAAPPRPNPAAADPSDRYTVVGGLGVGGYSLVVCVRDQSSHYFAMKVVPKKYDLPQHQNRLRNEAGVMLNLEPHSPFVQRCVDAFESERAVFLVNELLPGGDLFYHLDVYWSRRRNGFGETRCKIILAEIVLGIEHLHRHGLVHRDVKIENVMVDREGHIKLIDFSLCHPRRTPSGPELAGSLHYMAPELLSERIVGFFTDWWALGVLAHELLTGDPPWDMDQSAEQLTRQIQRERVIPPRDVSPRGGSLICQLLDPNYRRRLGSQGSEQVRAAPFFSVVSWEAVLQRRIRGPLPATNFTISEEDDRRILAEYEHGEEVERAPEPWFLGLPRTASRPTRSR